MSEGEGLLSRLTEAQMQALMQQGSVKAYPKNAVIVTEGDRSDALYIIISGKVKAYLSDENGKELELDTMGPGSYFGEMILDGGPRSASIMTREPCRFCVVNAAQFQAFLAANPDAAQELIRSLMGRIRKLTRVIGDFALLDVYARVARLLVELAEERDSVLVIPSRLTQQEIANRVGSSREMVSRIMKELRLGGYIAVRGDETLIIRKPPARW